jgi:hypothetical protein
LKNPYAILALFAIGYWIYSYHLSHALGILPFAIFLLCPLMHVFMHHGNNMGDSHCEHKSKGKNETNNSQETSSILGEKNDRE